MQAGSGSAAYSATVERPLSVPRAAVVLARPAMVPWLWLLVCLGFGFGHWDHAAPLQGAAAVERLGVVLFAWTLLHVGAMWRNAARDRDTGPVMFGRAVPVPRGLGVAGDAALLGAGLAGLLGPPVAAVSVAVCALLGVAYSHPGAAWKGHPVLGPAVNVVGYGLLSPLAGWSAAGLPATPRLLSLLLGSSLALAGLTFAAQVFQGAEDAARGDRTLVVTHGPAVCVEAARWLFLLALGVLLVQAAIGWLPRLLLLVAVPGLGMARHLASWAREPLLDGPGQARRTFQWMVGIGVLLVGLALVDFALGTHTGQPVSGLGTATVPRF